jgi:hypothetical protein
MRRDARVQRIYGEWSEIMKLLITLAVTGTVTFTRGMGTVTFTLGCSNSDC